MIGELYERALTGRDRVEIEHADGRRRPLRVADWFALHPGDGALLDRSAGATLDVGSGPGRLTVALAERGVPVLGIDVTPYAVALTRAAGGLALRRDVFDRVPGAGRWDTVLLADGNIGIGGDPETLLARVMQLLRPGGAALVEVEPPGFRSRCERVRLRGASVGGWFDWALVSADDLCATASLVRATVVERSEDSGRWFVTLRARR